MEETGGVRRKMKGKERGGGERRQEECQELRLDCTGLGACGERL